MNGIFRACTALTVAWVLTGCSSMSMDFLRPAGRPLETLTQQIGPEAPTLRFDFEFDDKANAAEGEVGSGYIVVSQEGKELQALPHAFELPRDRLDGKAWLSFGDFNGDGLTDFKVTRLYAMEGKLAVDSLYQFDARTGRFAQVDVVSNAGEIEAVSPGCVSVKVQSPAGAVRQENHCYVAATGRWVRGRADVARKTSPAERADANCDATAPELIACRRARIEQDKALLTLVREYRNGRMQTLQAAQGRDYAEAYARSLDLDHSSWRQYRDARCTAQSREQAVPVKALAANTELCRYEWARDQLRRYRDQIARLSDNRDKGRARQ